MHPRYTLHIGTKSFSSWSLRPWLAMKHAGLSFTEDMIALRMPDTKQRIALVSPSGKVPALTIEEDGRAQTIWDSLAICETIAERHPEALLWPHDPAARAEARSLAAEMHAGFPDVRKNLSMDIGKILPTPELDEATSAQVARLIALWESALKRYGGEFLCGSFSIADCFYAPVVTRFETYSVALPPASEAYAARIQALPSMREWRQAALAETRPAAPV
jgi:glutathione S-transferase